MKRLAIVVATTLGVLLVADPVLAQVFRGGMRGAVAGGLIGGREGAATGAKIGVVTGATRAAINRA